MKIDLRSDTVTKPSVEMKAAMMDAELGDDVYGEDPSVNEFEGLVAKYFGVKHAIFCPSATMSNQIAIRLLTNPQDQIICAEKSHIYHYEGGGPAYNSMVSLRLIQNETGILSSGEIEQEINPKDIHFPKTSLIVLENTCNKGGGLYYSLEGLKDIKALAEKNSLAVHLDGARVFNAIVASDIDPKVMASQFDTLSVCFSKGMGCPVGSVLLLNNDLDFEARRIRKVLGGGMRQAGILAAAGSFALKNNIRRLSEDHEKVSKLAKALERQAYIVKVFPFATNILLFSLQDSEKARLFTNCLQENNVLISAFGPNILRIVTHLDFNNEGLNKVLFLIENWQPE